jgi:hypothetical protein
MSDDNEERNEREIQLETSDFVTGMKELAPLVLEEVKRAGYEPIAGILVTMCKSTDEDNEHIEPHLSVISSSHIDDKHIVSGLLLAAITRSSEEFFSFIHTFNQMTDNVLNVPKDKMN